MTLHFLPASQFSIAQLADAMTHGYEGYFVPVTMDADRMQAFIVQHDIDVSASVVVRTDDEIIGIANLGRRGTLGWVGGIGVIPAWRRKGVGKVLMTHLINAATTNGIQELYLEVLTQNAGAYALYQQLGFVTLRKLLILDLDAVPVQPDLPDVLVSDVTAAIQRATPVRNPWQSQPATLHHKKTGLQSLALQKPANTEVIFSINGSNLQVIEIRCSAHQAPAAVQLIGHLRAQYPNLHFYMVNLPEEHPAWAALQQHGAIESMSQFEMLLRLY